MSQDTSIATKMRCGEWLAPRLRASAVGGIVEVLVACVVSELRERVLKSGKANGFVAIEDQTARTEVLVFSRVFAGRGGAQE